MMKTLPDQFRPVIKVVRSESMPIAHTRLAMTSLLLFFLVWGAAAQTVTWSDSFSQGQSPTLQQCENWTNFLGELGGKNFSSVTISGTFDKTGKTISDPVAANALAALLHSKTPGTVQSGNHHWTVTICQAGACGGLSIALSVNGSKTSCECTDTYAIRPQSTNQDWGGVNVASSCSAPSQAMKLVFSSGVTISVDGSTTLCEGSSTTLTANAEFCSQQTYLWSNGATTPSITVSEAGTYSVVIEGADGCRGTERVTISRSDVGVNAGEDLSYCQADGAVQLNAIGTSESGSGSMTNQVCIYNSPGGVGIDDCNFTSDVCLEGATFVGRSVYSKSVAFSNPTELRYHIYYSAFADVSVFRFKLNGQELGSFTETNATGVCDTKSEQKFPRTVSFEQSEFNQHWIDGGNNEIRVEIETPSNGIYLAGITAEVITANETYAWSPAAGLSDPSIRNPQAAPLTTTVYSVTYTDANGCSATDQVEVKVNCGTTPPPVAVCKELVRETRDACEVIAQAAEFNGGSTGTAGGPLTFTVSPAGPYPVGVTTVALTVTDSNGGSSVCTTTITVKDVLSPTVVQPEELVVANEEGKCSATVALTAPEAFDNCGVEEISNDHDGHVFPVGETLVTWTVIDLHGNAKKVTQKVIVNNSEPVIESVHVSSSSVGIGNPVTVTTVCSDNNINTASISWGDGSPVQIVNSPVNLFDVTHSYKQGGSYVVTVSITDLCGVSTSYDSEIITVSDNAGSVRGDGWFHSHHGYYLKNKRASGKAQFHFDAKYKKGSSQPAGSVFFRFKEGKIEFRSTSVNQLLVEGDRATLTASGKLNGKRNFTILIGAVDEDGKNWDPHGRKDKKKDQIRVKIWDPSGTVIYDTQPGEPDDVIATTDVGGGSIEVDRKNKFTERLDYASDSYFGEESSSVYPNPFADRLNIQFNAASEAEVIVQLMDLSGKVVAGAVYPVSDDGQYSLDIPEDVLRGIYILTVRQGQHVDFLRVVRN